jgi:phosphocarrier protein
MVQRQVQIQNQLGLHARAAAKLVHLASRFQCAVRLKRDAQEVNGKSILGVLLLAAAKGATVELICEGEDEKEALEALQKLFDDRFDEEPKAPLP